MFQAVANSALSVNKNIQDLSETTKRLNIDGKVLLQNQKCQDRKGEKLDISGSYKVFRTMQLISPKQVLAHL